MPETENKFRDTRPVVVVSDDPDVLDDLAALLVKSGYTNIRKCKTNRAAMEDLDGLHHRGESAFAVISDINIYDDASPNIFRQIEVNLAKYGSPHRALLSTALDTGNWTPKHHPSGILEKYGAEIGIPPTSKEGYLTLVAWLLEHSKMNPDPHAGHGLPEPDLALIESLQQYEGQNSKILLVERDPEIRNAMAKKLKGIGFKVFAAASEEDAYKLHQRSLEILGRTVDILLIASNRRWKGGKTLAEMMNTPTPGIKHAPVITYVGIGSTGHRSTDYVLDKPFSAQPEFLDNLWAMMGDPKEGPVKPRKAKATPSL